MIFLAGLSGVLFACSGCSRMPWGQLSPQYDNKTFPKTFRFSSATPRLEAVWTSNGKRLWAVGESGTIVTSDDGKNWRREASGTENFLHSIVGTSDNKRLWAAGSNGTILESDDGEHWKSCASNTSADLESIYASSDAKHLWAVGDRGTILASDDGEYWSSQTSGTQNDLHSVYGTMDGKQVWAVGMRGTILESGGNGHWTPRSSGTEGYLWSIFGTEGGKRLWILSAEGKLLTSDDGHHWNSSSIGAAQYVTSIFVSDTGTKWVVGNNGTILRSEGGAQWKPVNSGTMCNLRSLTGSSDGRHLWAVGEQDTILQSEDGEQWQSATHAIQYDLLSVFGAADGRKLWIVGQDGRVLESQDGQSWKSQAIGVSNDLSSVFAVADGTREWAAGTGGTILDSEDGEHWQARETNTENDLHSIFANSDGNRAWAVGANGTIMKSADGEHWGKTVSGTLEDLNAVFGTRNGDHLWAVGENGTILESRDGESWTLDPNSSQIDLSSVFSTGDGKKAWAAGSNGTILELDDGKHWTAISSGTSQDLVTLFGTNDGKRLWAVGRQGTILQSDDGKHWNARSSGIRGDLLSVFVAGDGNRLWAAGPHGAILLGNAREVLPVLRHARLLHSLSGHILELRVEKETSTPAPTKIWIEGRNDYDNQRDFPWRQVSQCASEDQDPMRWQCSFQPSALSLNAGQQVHFRIHVERDRGADVYGFTALYDPWQWVRENSGLLGFVAALLLCIGLPTVLLFVHPLGNLTLYRVVGLSQLEQIKIPVLGDFVQVAIKLVAVIPWFVRHPRTLDAWVKKYRGRIHETWYPESTLALPSSTQNTTGTPSSSAAAMPRCQFRYVPSPIRVDDPVSGSLIERPNAGEIRKFVKPSRTTIQIVGPGGAGKTTLARQVSEWAIQSEGGSGLSDHPVLPIWVDEELDPEKKTLSSVVKGRLIAALPDVTIEDELFSALLKRQRLFVILDRVSERSPTTQHYIETIYRSVSVGCLVLTSRTQISIDGAQTKYIYPQLLNSTTVANFMAGLLTVLLQETDSEGDLKQMPLISIDEQGELLKRLASLIRLRTQEGEKDIPLVPLVVRLFVEEAARLLKSGKALDNLPVSLPDVYFRHLRQVNPDDPSVPYFLPMEIMLGSSKLLGKLALQPDFIPKEFTRQQAVGALGAGGYSVTNSSDPLVRLTLNGVLFEMEGGIATKFRFSLDPIAEFLAAAAYADECENGTAESKDILTQSSGAEGFQLAFKLIRQAYPENRPRPAGTVDQSL